MEARSDSMNRITKGDLPRHIAIIMDGNGRWAAKRKQPRLFGHKKGADRVREVIQTSGELGIEVLTLFAFSDENWKRPEEEVSGLFNLLTVYLKQEIKTMMTNGVRLSYIGDISRIPEACRERLVDAAEKTAHNDRLHLVLALSYGGRSDIVGSVKAIAEQVKAGTLDPKDITDRHLEQGLFTAGIPEPDLLIRTGGEQRISNFLLWQLSYTELFFCPTKWPDFSKEHYMDAIDWFKGRERRFGQIRVLKTLAGSANGLHTSEASC